MDYIPVEIVALTDAPDQSKAFVLVLEESDGFRRLPIKLGHAEAQAIALAVQSRELSRPATHDLFAGVLQSAGLQLREAKINRMEGEAFCALLTFRKPDGSTFEQDARPSDAIALALRLSCPVKVADDIMDEHGVLSNRLTPNTAWIKGKLEDYTLPELEALLQQAVEREDYQSASRIRDAITRLSDS
jgi:bifunctional DNase/RNase